MELTTPPDPNWFYSSVAQSAAAFAGLFGALLISRFLHQLGVVRESRSNVVRRFHRVRGQVDNLYSQTVQYALNVRDELAKDEATIERGLKTRHVDVRYTYPGSSESGGHGWDIELTPFTLQSRRAEFRHYQELADALGVLSYDLAVLTKLDAMLDVLIEKSRAVPASQTHIMSLVRTVRPITRLAKAHSGRILPQHLFVSLGALATLCFASVVWPLSFLTGLADASKPWILAVFALGLLTGMGYLGFLLWEIQRVGSLKMHEVERDPEPVNPDETGRLDN